MPNSIIVLVIILTVALVLPILLFFGSFAAALLYIIGAAFVSMFN